MNPATRSSAVRPSDRGITGDRDGVVFQVTAAKARAPFAAPCLLLALVFLTFIPALDAGYVGWDDDDLLQLNTVYQSLNANSLAWMFSTSLAGHFQPLTWLSYWLDWQIWRGDPFGFHLTNLILHALTSLAFYFLVRRLLTIAAGAHHRPDTTALSVGALFAASVFAVHPLRVESVAWLAERRDVLSGLFYVLAALFYIRYAIFGRKGEPLRPIGRTGLLLASLLFFGLSLLAKAAAVTLPLVLIVLDVYPLRRIRSFRSVTELRSSMFDKAPFFVLAGAAAWRAVTAQENVGALRTFAEYDLWSRLAQTAYGALFYIRKTLIPTGLGPLYEIPATDVLFGPGLWLSLAGLCLLGLVAWTLRGRRPGLATAALAYLITALPTLGLLQSGPQFVADRYSYLPCMSFAVLAGAIVMRHFGKGAGRADPNRRALIGLGCVVITTVLAKAAFAQCNIWLSPLTLWSHGVRVSPDSAVVHTNYADALATNGLLEEAGRHYRRALELDPDDTVALHHSGDLYARLGQSELAISFYLQSLRLDPDRLRACFSLGRLLLENGRASQGVAVLRDGTRRHPEALDLMHYLADVLATHPDASIRNGPEAVALALRIPEKYARDNLHLLLTLASAYAEAGEFALAAETAQHGLSLAQRRRNGIMAEEMARRMELFRAGRAFHYEARSYR